MQNMVKFFLILIIIDIDIIVGLVWLRRYEWEQQAVRMPYWVLCFVA